MKPDYHKIHESDLVEMKFSYFGTLVSGKNQEIDIFRRVLENENSRSDRIEIRVTMRMLSGAMNFSSISLCTESGAPVLILNERSRPVPDDDYDTILWDIIEKQAKYMDYIYGRTPVSSGKHPGSMVF